MSIILNIMGRKKIQLLPSTQKMLDELGNQIKLARLRRKIPVDLVAERAGVSRASVWAVSSLP